MHIIAKKLTKLERIIKYIRFPRMSSDNYDDEYHAFTDIEEE